MSLVEPESTGVGGELTPFDVEVADGSRVRQVADVPQRFKIDPDIAQSARKKNVIDQ